MTEKQLILLEIENELKDMTEDEKQDVLDFILTEKGKGVA